LGAEVPVRAAFLAFALGWLFPEQGLVMFKHDTICEARMPKITLPLLANET